MGLFNGLIGLLGYGSEKPIKAVSELYTTDKARLEAEKDLQVEVNKPILAQINTNAIMAAAQSIFVAGWQPLIGWTAGACIALYYVPQIIITNIIWAEMCLDHQVIYPFPMPADDILNLVYLLFGFGAYHLVKRKMLDK